MRRIGLDTNVLVYAHVASFEEHSAAWEALQGLADDATTTLVVSPLILHELVHVVTDGRRFDPPVGIGEALAVARGYLERTNVECVPIDEGVVTEAFDLLERHRLGRERIADTLLAASLLRNAAGEILTCNPDDFRIFDGLTPIDPTAPGD